MLCSKLLGFVNHKFIVAFQGGILHSHHPWASLVTLLKPFKQCVSSLVLNSRAMKPLRGENNNPWSILWVLSPARNHTTFLVDWLSRWWGFFFLSWRSWAASQGVPNSHVERLDCLKCPGNLLWWKQIKLGSVVDVFYWDRGCRHTNGERKLFAEWTSASVNGFFLRKVVTVS